MNDRKSLMKFVASMIIFGTIGVFRRYVPFSSTFLAFARGILGGLCLTAFVKLKGRREDTGKLPGRTVCLLAVSGAAMGVNWILLFEAYNHTTVGIATLCYYMEPTIVTLASPFFFKEKLTWRKGLCAAAALGGMVLVSGAAESGGVKSKDLQGILLGLGAAVFYSTVVIMNKKIRGVDAYRKTTIQLFSAGLVMAPYLLMTGTVTAGQVKWDAVLLLAVVGIVHTGIAYLLYFGSLEGLKAQTAAVLSYIDPVSALLFSAIFLREPLSAAGIAGAVMIIGSAVVSDL